MQKVLRRNRMDRGGAGVATIWMELEMNRASGKAMDLLEWKRMGSAPKWT